MSLLGTAIQRSIRLAKSPDYPRLSPAELQERQLLQLLRTAQHTSFGQYHGFVEAALSPNPVATFQQNVPAADYNQLYNRWWNRAHLCDTPDVTWPGHTPYYALSSGTSQSATKYIPVTHDMLRATKRGSRRMFYDLAKYNLSSDHFTKQMLMVGSCTVVKPEGRHQTGDLSGILGLNRPLWMSRYYRPGRQISDLTDWDARIDAIVDAAPGWDIGSVVGNPAWVQMIFERMLDRHHVREVRDLWPNLSVLVHSGVFFEPYRPMIEQLVGGPLAYIDSYLASEGFIAYQNRPGAHGMRLLLDCGVFFEFVPFNDDHFDDNGDLRSQQPKALTFNEVRENEPYALLLSTCSGAWRYLLGDVVQFTDVERAEIRLVGRTKQFLSSCGEHLSIDNLTAAVRRADERLHAGVREFAVSAKQVNGYWAHQWWVSIDNPAVSPAALAQLLDEELCLLNDDYRVERQYALRDVQVELLPNHTFFDWLASKGKMNGQAKVPRVLKGAQLADFEAFLNKN